MFDLLSTSGGLPVAKAVMSTADAYLESLKAFPSEDYSKMSGDK